MCCTVLCSCNGYLYAQSESEEETGLLIETAAEDQTEDMDYSEAQEQLEHYREVPLDLNSATEEQLQVFWFLTPLQLNSILEYRKANSRFIEVQELQAVANLDAESIRKLIPFVTVRPPNSLQHLREKTMRYENDHDLIITLGRVLQKQEGYHIADTGRSRYEGTPLRFLTRYRYRYGQDLSFALTMEKDPGEGFFSGSATKGFDFYSASLFVRNAGKISKLVLGDYSLQFGQGLAMWQGMSFGKGVAVSGTARHPAGLKPYTSANEALFLRGVAATVSTGSFELTPFLSYRKLDATVARADTSGDSEGINSLSQSGLHRTPSEINNHNSTAQLVYGADLHYSGRRFRTGTVIYHTSFSKAFLPGKYLYEQYQFSGRSLSNVSVYCNYNWQNVYFFGEGACSLNGGSAFISGALAGLSRQVSAVVLYRDYRENYYSFFNQGFAEAANGTAERGVYWGLMITPGPKMELSAYADVFRFPWLKYRTDAPSAGHELLAQWQYAPRKDLKLIVRYRLREKQENDNLGETVRYMEQVRRQNFRLELQCKTGAFLLRNRAELAVYTKGMEKEQGVLLYQDVIVKPMGAKLSANLRFALFGTDGFNSRIYAYENDVLYSYSIPAYQNNGTRFYLNGKYRIGRRADLSVRYAITSYINTDEIGSGLDKINGHNRSDIKLQLRLRF